MRYNTLKEAKIQAKIESAILNRKVKAIKSKYYNHSIYDYVSSYTTILVD